MSVLKLTKKDITSHKSENANEGVLKLKKSDLVYDAATYSAWEQSNKEAIDILNRYNDRVNKQEWISSDDLASYRKALDSYISTSNSLRGLNKIFGKGYTDEEETSWADTLSSLGKGYEDLSAYYTQFDSEDAFKVHLTQNEMASFDLEAGQFEIDDLQSKINRYRELDEEMKQILDYATSRPGISSVYADRVKALGEERDSLGDIDELTSLLDEKKWYYDQASQIQKERKETEELAQLAKTPEAPQGWAQYTADMQAASDAEKQEKEDQKWWEEILANMGTTPDTTIPGWEIGQAVNDLREDDSYKQPNDKWSEDQKLTFGALYLKSKQEAYDYAIKVNNQINNAEKQEKLKPVQEFAKSNIFASTAGTLLTNTLGWADVLSDWSKQIAWGTIVQDSNPTPFEYGQAMQGSITSHLNTTYGTIDERIPIIGGSGVGDVYSLGVSTAQSIIYGYTLGGAGMLLSYIGQGAASGTDDALARGATGEQALLYGLVVGLTEGIAEKMGIDHLFSLKSTDGIIKMLFKQAGAEGMEEGVTSLISNIADNLIMKSKSNYNIAVNWYTMTGMSLEEAKKLAWQESIEGIAFDTLGGALSGGTHAGIQAVGSSALSKLSENKQAIQTYGNGADLVTEALEIDSNNAYAQRMQGKLDKGKSLSGGQISKLVNANNATLRSQDISKIESAVEARLTELGEKTGDVKHLAKILAKQASGEALTRSEQTDLELSDYGNRVANELNPENIESGGYSSAWAESIDTDKINADAYSRKVQDLDTEQVSSTASSKSIPATKNTTSVENATESEIEASDSRITINKDGEDVEVKIDKIDSIDNGEMSVKLDNGDTVSIDDLNIGGQMALVYQAASEMATRVGGFNVDTANVFVKGYDPSSGLTAAEYIHGFSDAYRFGRHGYPVSELDSSQFTSKLGVDQRSKAYNLGKIFSSESVAKIQQSAKKAGTSTTKKKGRVYFDGRDTGKNLTEIQRASLKGLRVVAEALGVDIHVFESTVDKRGKRQGANGWYNTRDNSIHIDLYAGKKGDGLMLFTAAHELTHHIKAVSDAKFKLFADALFEEYGKHGKSVEELIEKKKEFLEEQGRIKGMTEEEADDLAYEEVVADACEAMLVDSNAFEAMSRKIHERDKGLWETIKDFITKLVARIKAAYKERNPNSAEANYVRDMVDSAERLQKLWVDALIDASETSKGVSVAEGDVKHQDREVDTNSIEYKINTSMTMAEAKRMIETAYKIHGIAEYFEGEYKDAVDWLRKAGAAEVEMYIENDYDLQAKYINSNEDILNEEYSLRDVLQAYLAGTLIGKEKAKPKRLDVSKSTGLQDSRFYSPQKIEEAKALFELAKKKAVGKDANAINRARAEILLFAHNKGAAELLGITQAELNKLLRNWSKYSATAKSISEKINAGVAEENRWTGIENSAYISKAKVTNEDIERLVASVEGDSRGYERRYIARVMLAADTHIDYSGLKFKFASSQQVNADHGRGDRVLGFYDDTNRLIEVSHDRPHTVAHEMGHYIDAQWGRDLVGSTTTTHLFLTHGVNADIVRERYGEPGVQFLNNFNLFMNSLSEVNQNSSSYYNDRKEIFARFFAKFIEWTDNIATGTKYFSYETTMYGDKFTQAQFVEFARLLQEKALLDGSLVADNVKFSDRDSSRAKITADMTDEERYEVLKKRSIKNIPLSTAIPSDILEKMPEISSWDDINKRLGKDKRTLIQKLTKEFGVFDKEYFNEDIELSFEFSGNNFRESYNKQGHNYIEFAKMFSVFDQVIESAVGIEIHNRTDYKPDPTLKNVFVLISAYQDGDYIVPVKLEVKQFKDKQNSLYVAISLKKIKMTEVLKQGNTVNGVTQSSRSVNVSIPQLFAKINPSDKNFLKYIPDGFLDDKQKTAKQEALGENSDIRYSDRVSYAPTFYSHMGKVIDGIKIEKMGAGGVVSYLKGKGVKDEEIKWSGIEAFLEGKKSVTKAELQEFVASSQLQIEETNSGINNDAYTELDNLWRENFLSSLEDVFDPEDFDEITVSAQLAFLEENGMEMPSEDIQQRMIVLAHKIGKPTRWEQYKLDGGTNYRELVFKLPNSSFTNQAMRAHWGQDAEGILVHARIQDFVVNGKKMLFVEELQSDWHNEGAKDGYVDSKEKARIEELRSKADEAFFAVEDYSVAATGLAGEWEVIEKTPRGVKLLREYREAQAAYDNAMNEFVKKIPDAPFRDNYHEYVIKRLLRMAAEEGYDSIGWTPSEVQMGRWNPGRRTNEEMGLIDAKKPDAVAFEDGYRIEYDQDIPKFLRKYGKRWGATVGKTATGKEAVTGKKRILKETELENVKRDLERAKQELARKYDSYEKAVIQRSIDSMEKTVATLEQELSASLSVWSMDIPDSMKESVLYEGQVLYSDRRADVSKISREIEEDYADSKGVIALADKYFDGYGGTKSKSEFRYEFLQAMKTMLGKTPAAIEEAYNMTVGIAEDIVYNPKNLGGLASDFADMQKYIRSVKLKVQDQDKGELRIRDGYGEFRKRHMGKLNLANTGLSVDVFYEELQELYGKHYFPDMNSIGEQLMVMADIMDTPLSSLADFDYDPDEACRYTTQEIFEKLVEFLEESALKEQRANEESDTRYITYRNPDSLSNRSLLAGALESVAQNDIEREKLRQYKEKIDLINAEQVKLQELREKIKDLSFAKGPRDTEAIRSLQFEANQTANRINTYDRQLLTLESTKALKGVLDREKQLAYQRAERKGKEALGRAREKARERAAETQRKLLDRFQESKKRAAEGREKTAMRHKIKDVVNELNQYLLKGTKDRHVPIELQKAVAEALDAVNMDTVGAEERIAKLQAEMMRAKTPEETQAIAKKIEHIQEMGGNMEKKISRLKTAYDSIINSDDPLIANSHDEVISNTIDRVMQLVGDTPLRDMSLHQLEEVYEMYKMVLHSIRSANKAFKAKKSEEISVIANRVLEEIEKLGKKRIYRSKTADAVSAFDWNNLKPVYAFERIGSASFTDVFDSVRAGEDTWAVDMDHAQGFREEQYKKYKYDSWDFNKKHKFTSTTGKSFELTLGQIMSLYAFAKRGDQAKDHLRYGGFVFDGLTEVKVKNKVGVSVTYQLKDATAYNLSEEILASIIGALAPEQTAFVDAMQDYLSTVMGEKGNEVSLELYGIKLFKEKNYFPLKSAPQFLERAREQAQGDVKIKNKGFTKETTPKARNPIVLTSFMDVWAGHVNEMSMYHAFTLALEDFYRVFNYKTPASETMDSESVISFLENAHGAASVSYIDQLLKDLNGGARSDPRETIGKALMSRFKKTAVMGSLSVVVQQPTSIVRAMALVDAKHFGIAPIARGTIRTFNRKKHKELWAEVKKYAPVAIIKEMGNFDTGMGQSSVEWLKGEKTFMDKVDDVLSKAPAVADELAWITIWEAVKRETIQKNPKLKANSDEFLKLCGERFTEVVTKTQVYDSTLAKSSNMRSKGTLMNMWTAFMAEPTTSINMVMDAFRKGDKKYTAKVLGSVLGSVALNAALVSLIYAMRDDDEDETYAEKYLSRFTTEFLDGINPITYIPFAKDIWSVAQGFDIERSDMSLITSLVDSLQKTTKVLGKDTSNMDEDAFAEHQKQVSEALWSIVDGIASIAGIPEKNIRRDFNGIINLFKTLGKDMDTSFGSLMDNIAEELQSSTPVWNWFPGESKGDKLYDAIVRGDTAYVERLKSGYKTESDYNSAVRKALRENDSRIKEAAEAFIDGDYTKYNSLREEIVGEGIFSREIVTDALKAEYQYLKQKAKESNN